MASKKGSPLYIGLALLAIGTISLLAHFKVIRSLQQWWMPIILIIVGILVVMDRKGAVNILGWICVVYGVLLLLMALGVFSLAFLTQITPVSWILFGLILLL